MKKNLLFCIVAFLSSTPYLGNSQAANTQDSLALVDLYNSTNGPSWTNRTKWLTPARLSTWYGILVENGRVTEIDMDNNNVSGPLPSSIGNLTKLKKLRFFSNNLTGSIPTSIDGLVELKTLSLNFNQLSGPIPESIGNLPKLEDFLFAGNALTGSLPASMGNLSSLLAIQLSSNQLSGDIPQSLGNLKSLYTLELGNNQLTGSIPASLVGLTSLHSLSLSINKLSGPVPAFLGDLPLNYIDLYKNYFTFDGLELIEQYYGANAYYTPQAKITLNEKNNLLSVYAGGTLSNNTYRWFKNGALVATIQGDSTYEVNGGGDYYVTVNNAIADDLTLESTTVTIGVLPITILDFRGVLSNKNASISWLTLGEENVKSMTLQRSIDGINFTSIASFKSHNGPGNHTYNYQDSSIASGLSYYRLVLTGNDGNTVYSKLVSIKNINLPFQISIYPNPVGSNGATISFDAASKSKYTIKIIDATGKTLGLINGVSSIGRNQTFLNLAAYAKGAYTVIFENQENFSTSVKLVKL